MRVSLRSGKNVIAIAVTTAMAAALAGCSQSYDTTQVEARTGSNRQAAPTTSIVVETIPPSTEMALQPLATTPSGIQATLTQLVGQFAQNPDLVATIGALQDGDLASIAALLDIDLEALSALGLSTSDISSIGDSVLGTLAGSGGAQLLGLLDGGSIDPMTLIGLLAQSVDIDLDLTSLAAGAIPQLIGALLSGLQGAQLTVTPEITLQLGDMLDKIDPHAFDNFVITPENAPFVALLTSVILGNNPLLQQGVMNNPNLDPNLRNLLDQLADLNNELGETTSSSIYEAILRSLFPNGFN